MMNIKNVLSTLLVSTLLLTGAVFIMAPAANAQFDVPTTPTTPNNGQNTPTEQGQQEDATVTEAAPGEEPIAATPKESVCNGITLTGGSCDPPAEGQPTVAGTIKTAINILSFVVGVVAVIMVIVGGFKYVISSGESSNVNGAKNTILYALIGLVIVAMAQVIVRFVLNQVT